MAIVFDPSGRNTLNEIINLGDDDQTLAFQMIAMHYVLNLELNKNN